MRYGALFVAVLLAACGSDATNSGVTYSDISGSFAGPLTGLSQGVALSMNLSLTITQNQGSASGTYASTGNLNDGHTISAFTGTGTFTGTVQSGSNPSVNFVLGVPGCPNYAAHFSGSYDSTNHRLTITGPIDFFNSGTCTVGLSYQSTLILTN